MEKKRSKNEDKNVYLRYLGTFYTTRKPNLWWFQKYS